MKKIILSMSLFLLLSMPVQAEEITEPQLIRCTCYTSSEGSITADGSKPIEGYVAGKREWLGYLCIMYENDNGKVGDFIGYFDFRDTGGAETLKNGTSIDVYRDTLDGCYDWIAQYGDYVFVQIIKAEG